MKVDFKSNYVDFSDYPNHNNINANHTHHRLIPGPYVFAFTFYHPMQIYLGKYSILETIYVFGGGIVWCIILYYSAKWVFKMGLKRNEAVGL